MNSKYSELAGKQILVTGATGFIGGRLVERLVLECNAQVRAVVRDFARLPRIARFPIEIIRGDVTNFNDIQRAVDSCDIVFDCSYDKSGDVKGTKNVMEAALQANIKRVVHLSSLMVYGITPDGDLDETAPRRALDDIYSESKLESEKLVFDYVKRYSLPVVVLQPTGVYGPYSDGYCINILNKFKKERRILVNGGDGLFNSVYIDDVISAMLLAAITDKAVGEAFLISSEAITWREFYSRFEQMLGICGTVTMSISEAEKYYVKIKKQKRAKQRIIFAKNIARAALPDGIKRSLKRKYRNSDKVESHIIIDNMKSKPIYPEAPWALPFYASKTTVKIDKAKRILEFEPEFSFDYGMQLTRQWASWANLLD